jgi:hypothetical protein
MTTRMRLILAAALLALGCQEVSQTGDGPVPPGLEIVMAARSTLTVTNTAGTLAVKAGNGVNRCYTWDAETRCIEMWPREHRWEGSRGLYFPGPGEHWADNHGVTRGVLEESLLFFHDVAEFMVWLKSREGFPFVYRNDGLVAGWRKNLDRKQLNVEVYQVLLGDQMTKPTSLPGADDAAITTSAATLPPPVQAP